MDRTSRLGVLSFSMGMGDWLQELVLGLLESLAVSEQQYILVMVINTGNPR